jgi:hypothetical protein
VYELRHLSKQFKSWQCRSPECRGANVAVADKIIPILKPTPLFHDDSQHLGPILQNYGCNLQMFVVN